MTWQAYQVSGLRTRPYDVSSDVHGELEPGQVGASGRDEISGLYPVSCSELRRTPGECVSLWHQ